MRKIRLFILSLVLIPFVFFAGCARMNGDPDGSYYYMTFESGNEYKEITENPFVLAGEEAKSTFSLDVNTASYSNLRKHIVNGYQIDRNQIRIEEMVNYFKYDYPEPQEGPLSVTASLYPCPWNGEARLLQIGLKSEEVDFSTLNNNLVFLLDVSGSMNTPDKIGLMKSAFSLLVENLNDNDTISIVTYAGSDRVVLQGAKGCQKNQIIAAIEDLEASGMTAGAQGIVTAYSLAQQYFIEGGNNRVILATDGDFNVGVSSESGLEALISQKRESGIYLSVLGFGYGNLKDNRLETLANNGNGNYVYIDTIAEAKKVLVEQIGGTLRTVAKDAKAQVEFNPAKSTAQAARYENNFSQTRTGIRREGRGRNRRGLYRYRYVRGHFGKRVVPGQHHGRKLPQGQRKV